MMRHSKTAIETSIIMLGIGFLISLACVLIGCNTQPEATVLCDPEEVAFYESQGWDSWECHMDKTTHHPDHEWLGDVIP